jgi:MFS family permease
MDKDLPLHREQVCSRLVELRQSESLYGWVIVLAAAVAMGATLPGRTHGLGLITKHLLDDFPSLSQQDFGRINLWATLIGAAFCLPCGWLLDRLGIRILLTAVMATLARIVLWMSQARDVASLVVAVTLSRGIGQSMLSVVSITMIGKWFQRNVGPAMGVYSIVMTMLMAVATGALAERINRIGWRVGWWELGISLALAAIICAALGADPRRRSEVAQAESDQEPSATLWQALGTSCFWVFALAISFFGLVTAGISLWQQLILEERGLPADVFRNVLIIGLLVGMLTNLVAGALTRVCKLSSLLGAAMLLLGVAYLILPLATSAAQAYCFAVVQGVAGGILTVAFFAVWRHAFGQAHLGRIQGAAQMLTVLASAVGPLIVAESNATAGTYARILFAFAAISVAFGVAAFMTPVPSAAAGAWRVESRSNSPAQLQESAA